MKEIPDVLWSDREEIVVKCLERIPQRSAFVTFIEGIAEAKRTKDLLKVLKMDWSDFVELYGYDRRLYSLYLAAKERGEAFRQLTREEEADRRAVDGVLEEVYHKGEICGYVRKYSDQMLALQLKAGNPDKYAERSKVESTGTVLNLSVKGVERAPIDVTEE